MGSWPEEAGGLHIYASALTPANELGALNAFRPILQAMLVTLQGRKKHKKSKILRHYYEGLGLSA